MKDAGNELIRNARIIVVLDYAAANKDIQQIRYPQASRKIKC
jgi:hypothetical protein